jgi:ABC-2 type transport system permease protein
VAARVLTYWRRDPRYQISMAMTPLVPLALLVPFIAGDVPWTPLLMGPLVAFLLGWSEHNAVAYESDALWLHVVSGVSGRADRRGRIVPALLLAAVLVPVYVLVGVAVAGRWDLLPAVLGLSVGLLGSGYAVSSVMNVVLPYPVPESGESPFNAPPGAAGITIAAQSIARLATIALTAPTVQLAWLAWQGSAWAGWAAGLVGVCLGVVVGLVGVATGARLYDRRAPELLSTLRRACAFPAKFRFRCAPAPRRPTLTLCSRSAPGRRTHIFALPEARHDHPVARRVTAGARRASRPVGLADDHRRQPRRHPRDGRRLRAGARAAVPLRP